MKRLRWREAADLAAMHRQVFTKLGGPSDLRELAL